MLESPTESSETPESRGSGWGGSRRGAGRRPREMDKWCAARGIKPATAAEILDRADERRIWYRLLNSEDDSVALRALTYLTDRRDGRAAQQINLTQVGLTISPSQVESARAIVREIMSATSPAAPSHPLLEASNGSR